MIGQSFSDICLGDADEIARAIETYNDKYDGGEQYPKESHIYKLC